MYFGRNQARPTASRAERTSSKRARSISRPSARYAAAEARGEPQSRKGGDERLKRRSEAEKVGVFRSKPSEADGERPEPTSRRRGRSTSGSRRDRPKDTGLLELGARTGSRAELGATERAMHRPRVESVRALGLFDSGVPQF